MGPPVLFVKFYVVIDFRNDRRFRCCYIINTVSSSTPLEVSCGAGKGAVDGENGEEKRDKHKNTE